MEPQKVSSKSPRARRRVSPSKSFQVMFRVALSIAILGGSVAIFFLLGPPESSKRKKGRFNETPTVETVQAETHTLGIDFEVDGVVIPFRKVVVSPEVSGRVVYKSSNCRRGRFVKKGECLFRIDRANYELDVQRLDAMLDQAKASINECDIELRNLTEQITLAEEQVKIQKREVKRYESVDDPGVYSGSEIDQARNSELSSRNSLQQLQSQHRLKGASRKRLLTVSQSAKIQLDRATLDLKRTEVCAPLSGVVTTYDVEQDSYLQGGAAAVTIQDISRLDIRSSLHMQQVGWLWQTPSVVKQVEAASEERATPHSRQASSHAYRLPSLPVTVTFKLDNACWAWKGSLTSYDGSSVNENTRMMPCRVTVENPLDAEAVYKCGTTTSPGSAPPTLMAGMFVEVQIHSKPEIPLLRIQETALLPGNQVWTANGGKLKKHHVRVAQIESGEVIIYVEGANMATGDQVVVSPLATPVEGMKVKLMPETPKSSILDNAPVAVGSGEASQKF